MKFRERIFFLSSGTNPRTQYCSSLYLVTITRLQQKIKSNLWGIFSTWRRNESVDTFDPKTKASIGGRSKPVKTQSDDLLLSDQLPKLGQQAKDLSVIRSLTTKTGAHSQARYVMHTGYRQRSGMTHPQLGSWAQMFLGKSDPVLPSSVVIASGNPGPGFLPPDYSPLPIGNASRGIKDLLRYDRDKLNRRVRLAKNFRRFHSGFT